MEERRCTGCGNIIPPEGKGFCPFCGTPYVETAKPKPSPKPSPKPVTEPTADPNPNPKPVPDLNPEPTPDPSNDSNNKKKLMIRLAAVIVALLILGTIIGFVIKPKDTDSGLIVAETEETVGNGSDEGSPAAQSEEDTDLVPGEEAAEETEEESTEKPQGCHQYPIGSSIRTISSSIRFPCFI